jgi:hypothetical protein
MHPEVTTALKTALQQCLPVMQQLSMQCQEPALVWHRGAEGNSWQGEWRQSPDLRTAFSTARPEIERNSEEFVTAFRTHHPDHTGLVGLAGMGSMQLFHDSALVVSNALDYLWHLQGAFSCDEHAIDAVVTEFASSIDCPLVRLRFWSQLLNFTTSRERIELPAGLIIRRLNEDEVSKLYGGSTWHLSTTSRRLGGFAEFVVEGEYDEQKVSGDVTGSSRENVRQRLDRAMLALRTFKEGRVGYEWIHYQAVSFCPLPLGSYTFGDLHTPVGTYSLDETEIAAFCKHAVRIFSKLDASMEMACSRLADAQTRFRPEDRLVDAVIGLEALLLSAITGDDRRGELSHRFSLHYSTFFNSPSERHAAYRLAKDLYGLRSMIAHGNPARKDEYRLGTEKVPLHVAASRSTEILQKVIRDLLDVGGAPYKDMRYWERRIFGLPEDSSSDDTVRVTD